MTADTTRQGLPRRIAETSGEPMATVSAVVPLSLVEAIDADAASAGKTRSQWVRELLVDLYRPDHGLTPPEVLP